MKLTLTLFVLAAIVAAVSRRRGVPAVRDVEADIARYLREGRERSAVRVPGPRLSVERERVKSWSK